MRFHLCQDNGILTQVRAPFVEASIVGVMLDSMKNKDLSGQSALSASKFLFSLKHNAHPIWPALVQ